MTLETKNPVLLVVWWGGVWRVYLRWVCVLGQTVYMYYISPCVLYCNTMFFREDHVGVGEKGLWTV